MLQGEFLNQVYGFWLTVYAITVTVGACAAIGLLWERLGRRKQLTWDAYTEYIDVSEFSNRNIPLRVTYKGAEPRWLWVTYLALRNTGRQDMTAADSPERQHFIAGAPGCRYIGFNRLLSKKAKVTLTPLFKGDDVYCKVEFDRLGPGDEILFSLLFVADEPQRVTLEGALFGAKSLIVSGQRQRMRSWRSLWWLLILVILLGTIGGVIFLEQSLYYSRILVYQFQMLVILYLLALATAAVLLRPIRYWEQIPERFHEAPPPLQRFFSQLRFLLWLSDEPPSRGR
jgi:hypothetical protein